jgi:tetratricopeptide (TPR) repeat protein
MTLVRVALLIFVIAALIALVQPTDSIAVAFVTRADEYRATFLYRHAADYLQLAATRQPWNAGLQLRLSEIAVEQHDSPAARRYLDRALALGADPMAVVRTEAEVAAQTDQYKQAAELWLKVARARPSDQAAWRNSVEAYLSAEAWPEARSIAEQWLSEAPSSTDAHWLLANTIALDDATAARDHFRQAGDDRATAFLAALDEADHALQLLKLGRAYLSDADLTLANRAFALAVEANPRYAEAYAYAGFTLEQLGGAGQAMLDRAVELDPDLVVARYFRALGRWQQGDLDGARRDLAHALEREPQNQLVAIDLGRVLIQRGDLAEAEKQLITARDLYPKEPAGWKALADLYVGRAYGAREQAIVVAQQAVNLAPDDAEAHTLLGLAYLLKGDRTTAESEWQLAVKLRPRYAPAYFQLGRLYGRNTEAGQLAYERAAALDLTGLIGAQAQRTLELP